MSASAQFKLQGQLEGQGQFSLSQPGPEGWGLPLLSDS